MKPAAFDYYAPASVEEALDQLAELGYNGKVLAGGQSLIPAMNFRMARPAALVDLNNIKDLGYIKEPGEGGLAIGTMTRDSVVEHSKVVMDKAPLVVEAMPFIGHSQIRNRGTFGGAIAHADPAGQLPGIALAMRARLHILKKGSDRWESIDDFFLGPFMTVIEPDEMLAEVVLPPLPEKTGTSYKQVSRQHGSTTQAAIASVVSLDDKGKVASLRVVMMSVGATPLVSSAAEEMLVGQEPSEAAFREIATKASETEIDPSTDMHATAEYRRHATHELIIQSLTCALERAKGKGG
ncbi:MAG: xanthine dehydrogenase family protein subunit M [Anaerolineaceae bacterium]|nr:xanthine dehydrogenase family protein subunit M [Anaerolineaceae bacterium]MBN2677729.1 xanthine dehydrogenase family protein subunit M [Anaerolineaceae bacterium]